MFNKHLEVAAIADKDAFLKMVGYGKDGDDDQDIDDDEYDDADDGEEEDDDAMSI